ncbi:hypothetical protein Tco_1309689 [Tanacetum coccineum]
MVSDTEVEEENLKSKDGVVSSEQNGKQSEDLFNIYSLLNKDRIKNNKEASTKNSLEYPPGFTPRENDVENVEMDNQKDNYDGEFGNVNNISDEVNFSSGFNTNKKTGGESMDSDHCRGGSTWWMFFYMVSHICFKDECSIMSDSEDSTVYDPPSPDYVPGPEEPEQAPPSPIYVPFVPEPVYPEFLPEDILSLRSTLPSCCLTLRPESNRIHS